MSTTKKVKIQNNKILTYSVSKSGFKQITKSVLVNDDATINEEMISQTSEDAPLESSDVLLGIAKFVDYFTPTGTQEFTKDGVTVSNTDFGLKKAGIKSASANLGVVSFLEFGEYIFINKAGTTKDGIKHDYTLTYNGTAWVLTEGATTIATDTLESFGLAVTGTPAQGDTITLKGAYYNKFAVFAITDSNFKTNLQWGNYGTDTELPNGLNLGFSSTWANTLLKKKYTFSTSTIFGYCDNKGIFVLPDNMQIQAVVPNDVELKAIWDIREALGIDWTSYSNSYVWSCAELYSGSSYFLNSNGNFNDYNKSTSNGLVAVFEVPVF